MKRVQYKRGQKLPKNTKYVARGSRWGNPYKIGDLNKVDEVRTRVDVLRLYEIWLDNKLAEDPTFLDSLKGYNLACYCPLDQACHADILLEALK